ncbi:FHA domain-containing protein [Microbacterium sp. G2-8]|uniref:FHA domain-containing protein n=1 Tax=Microbacterium sp. G2-8 TaxID=2842454 RepID=UPI001C8941BD|nr:FHA domain-containing protein [Microbacterium sp. G2-8]
MTAEIAVVTAAQRVAVVPAACDVDAVRAALAESVAAAREVLTGAAWYAVVDQSETPSRVVRHGEMPAVLVAADDAISETLVDAQDTSDPPASDEPDAAAASVSEPVDGAGSETAPVADDVAGTPVVRPGDHDGATMTLAQLRALRTRRGASAGDHDGATLSRDELRARRVAAQPVRATGRIRLSTGEVHDLDRPIVIGRSPRATRVAIDEAPLLLAVRSPEFDISRNHVEIIPEPDAVVVTDLRTTNGTQLRRAGADPVRLRPSERTVVVSGDVLDLGDGVTVAFEELP